MITGVFTGIPTDAMKSYEGFFFRQAAIQMRQSQFDNLPKETKLRFMKTERLTLEILTKEDVDLFHQINTHDFVKKHLWDNKIIPLSLAKDIVIESDKKFQTEKWGLWKIILKENKACIGYAGFWYFFDENQPQLLYALLPEYTGNGYATEASRELISYAFKNLKFNYLIATMDKPNVDSAKVCNRLNMELVEEKDIEGKPTLFFKLENKSYA
ncbi:MAG: GNAT family N-acetyltransferase [Flavobacteriales bacterium]|nr:GNAT family N-acetyltransferase [Flavobacteriales bacterium]